MCCRRRGNRGPALVVLGKFAYDKYQERKAIKMQEERFNNRSPSPEILEYQANSEILEKAGLPPPSYNEVVVNRAEIPESRLNISEKEVKGEKTFIDDLTDSQSLHEVPNGMRGPSAYDIPTQSPYVAPPATRGCCGRRNGAYASRCEQKRAEKMAREAEKQAAKLARTQMRM